MNTKELLKSIPPRKKAMAGAAAVLILLYVLLCGVISARQDAYAIRLSAEPAELTLAEDAQADVTVTIENHANRMISSQNDMRTYLVYRVFDASGAEVLTSGQVPIDPRIGSGRTGTVTATVSSEGLGAGAYRVRFDLQDREGFFSERSDSFAAAELPLVIR